MSLHTFCGKCRAFILVEIELPHDYNKRNYCEKCEDALIETSEEKKQELLNDLKENPANNGKVDSGVSG